jgi:thiamine transport system substrate-binding protein
MQKARAYIVAAVAALSAIGAASAEIPVLNVYTYSSFVGDYGPGKKLEAAFESECGCDLVFSGFEDTGGVLARLKLEGATSKADVVLGLDATQIAEAQGLTQAHGLPAADLALPGGWSEANFLPFDWGHLALIYDADRLTTPPTSLRALVETADGPTLLVQDPRTSAPGFGFLLWMRAVFGDDAPAAWTKLRPRIVTFTKGWSEAYDLFLRGEAQMVVSYTTSPAYHIAVEGKTNYKAAIFSDGHFLQIETMGITAASAHPDLARKFLTFMLTAEAQTLVAEGNWMLPARTPPGGLPPAFRDLPLPEDSLSLPPAEIDARRKAYVAEWLAAIAQ